MTHPPATCELCGDTGLYSPSALPCPKGCSAEDIVDRLQFIGAMSLDQDAAKLSYQAAEYITNMRAYISDLEQREDASSTLVKRLGRRIHKQRVRLRWWEVLFNMHVHGHLHVLHPKYFKKALELYKENQCLRQALSEAERREQDAKRIAVNAEAYGYGHGIEHAADIAEKYDHTDTLTAPKAIAAAVRALKDEVR